MRPEGKLLGAKPSSPEKLRRVLRLSKYTDASFTEFVPPGFDWFRFVLDYADLNDRLGDCVVAAMAKMARAWGVNVEGPTAPTPSITDADILDVYRNGAGYDPARPETDQGWDLLSALSYWQRIGIAGHKIGAYAAVDPDHPFQLRAATYLFGGVFAGFMLPNSIWNQEVWDVVPNDGGLAGGHCVTIQGVDRKGNFVGRTWGAAQPMTPRFVGKYCFEAYAIQSPEYLRAGKTIAGVNVAEWNADLEKLRSF